tara:strand:- start:16 stop:714 length:699 start_codon:yes stop_codon:yes gene_type:complete
MKAMILSAGYGKRLLPLTSNCPKPLLKINNETLLSNTIKFLIQCGVKQVVINVHYLAEQISDYIKKNKFDLKITISEEKERILDTGGGILNNVKYFSNEPFLVINPDTIWSNNYVQEFQLMKKFFFEKKQKCSLLIVNKKKSFDKKLKGDFNFKENFLTKENKSNLEFIFTGLQIINPKVFSNEKDKIFSINKIWNKLIDNFELSGFESNLNFNHVSTTNIYKDLLQNLNIK